MMPGDGNGGVQYGGLIERVSTLIDRVEDLGDKMDDVMHPQAGIYPQVARLQTAADQNEKDHRTFWWLFRGIIVLLLLLLAYLGPDAMAWLGQVI